MAAPDPEKSLLGWFRSGMPWIWLTAGTVSFSLIMVFGLLLLITLRGMGHFWPHDVARLHLIEGTDVPYALGQIVDRETVTAARVKALGIEVPPGRDFVDRYLLKIGNRDVNGFDFKWFSEAEFTGMDYPPDVFVAEREEWGNFYGYLEGVKESGELVASGEQAWPALRERLARKQVLKARISAIEKHTMGKVSATLERLRLQRRALQLDVAPTDDPRYADLEAVCRSQDEIYNRLSE